MSLFDVKKELLWCGFEATTGYNEYSHPHKYHRIVEDSFDRGVRTIIEVCDLETKYIRSDTQYDPI